LILGSLGQILITGELIKKIIGEPAPFGQPRSKRVALRIPMLAASGGEPIRALVGRAAVVSGETAFSVEVGSGRLDGNAAKKGALWRLGIEFLVILRELDRFLISDSTLEFSASLGP
jgi:hypothetical protein